MKLKRVLCLLLALATFACCFSAAAEGYADVPQSHWAQKYISWASQEGLMNGVGGGNFDPEGTVNRAMLVTVLWRMENSPSGNARAPFGDVASGQWYTIAIDWAYQNRIVNGTSPTTFAPAATLTREQAAAVLYRYSEYAGKRVSARADLSIYPDAAKVSSWAKENLSWANAAGLITGTTAGSQTVLDPQGTATRAQLATILNRYVAYIQANTPTPSIPTDPTGIQDYSKNNPLLAEEKSINTGVEPGVNIDTTGFVKNNIKINDFKGKTLTMITGTAQPNFIYKGPNGEAYDEWTWFEALKKTYGLNIKCIESRYDKAPQQIITYMNAGKSLDLYSTYRGGFPQYLSISAPLDPYINLQYVENSPGVDTRTMQQTKWDGTYRAIAPKGAVDVIWYNETMVASLGMPDPHLLWKQGKWDWDAWKRFLIAAPQTAPNGQTILCPWSQSESDAWTYWARTNGVDAFGIKTVGGVSTYQNNFSDPRALEAWNFYASTVKNVDYVNRRNSVYPQYDMYRDGSCIMSTTTYLMVDYSQYAYAKTQKYNWVPYPKGTGQGAAEIAMHTGITMMLPKKTKNADARPYAVKFMELWATRFTEAMNDYLASEPFGFTYAKRKEYFDFAAQSSYFPVGTAMFHALTGDEFDEYNRFKWSFYNPNYNTETQARVLYPLADKAIAGCMTWLNY